MRVATALEVRKRFGQIIDEAAAGERIVIERAGQPVAAIVPLSDLEYTDPERRVAARLAALDDIREMARRRPVHSVDGAAIIRRERDARTEHFSRLLRK